MLGLLITMWFINIPYECNQLLQNSCLGKKIKKHMYIQKCIFEKAICYKYFAKPI